MERQSGNLLCREGHASVSMQTYVKAVFVNMYIRGISPCLVCFYSGEGIEVQ